MIPRLKEQYDNEVRTKLQEHFAIIIPLEGSIHLDNVNIVHSLDIECHLSALK